MPAEIADSAIDAYIAKHGDITVKHLTDDNRAFNDNISNEMRALFTAVAIVS